MSPTDFVWKVRMLNFIGVGDLHMDVGLSKFIPNINEVILNEVRSGPIRYAKRNGIPLIVFYGDLCHTPNMSSEALEGFLDLFLDHQDLRFVAITGNHDVEYEGKHSLRVLKKLSERGAIPNLKVLDKPTTLFQKAGTPVHFLPWPHFDVRHDALNVMHLEVDGSQWDHGKSVESERSTKAQCVAGHLHTKQRVKNVHYSGTLYQTSFGEKPDKYFHHVSIQPGERAEIQLIPHQPKYRLSNVVIASREDLDTVEKNEFHLYKAFVKAGAGINPEDLNEYPNIVKVNSFANRAELEALVAEELMMQDTEVTVNDFSVMDALNRYMQRASLSPKVAKKAVSALQTIIEKNVKKD